MAPGKSRVKDSCQAFSDYTNFHGCKECFYANWCWKTIWTLILIACTAAMFYQSFNIIYQSFQTPTKTLVRRIDETPSYPPVSICYPHWVYWVDWVKVNRTNLNREAFLYGMSIFQEQFVLKPFNVSEAGLKFREYVSAKFPNLKSYYISIAKHEPLGYVRRDSENVHFVRFFHPQHGTEMCYSTNYTFTPNEHDGQKIFQAHINFIFPLNAMLLNLKEYSTYIHQAIEQQHKRRHSKVFKNQTYAIIHLNLILDGSDNKLWPNFVYKEYIVKLKGTVFDWANLHPFICSPGEEVGDTQFKHCRERCRLQARVKTGKNCWITFSESQILPKELLINDFCSRGVSVTNGSISDHGSVENIFRPAIPKYSVNHTNIKLCYNNCLRACRQWIYEPSIITNLNPGNIFHDTAFDSIVTIQYPSGEEILMFVEIQTETWDSLIAKIGGLIGLWIGGSVVTFLQAIYLCLWPDQVPKADG